jgi:hypothetical protein
MIENSSVFVLSYEFDSTLAEILNWFKVKGIKFFHVTSTTPIWINDFQFDGTKLIDFTISNLNTEEEITLSKLTGFLYRGGELNISLDKINLSLSEIQIIDVRNNFFDELVYLKRFIFKGLLGLEKVLGSPFHARPDKLEMLEIASSCGLITPATKIVTKPNQISKSKLDRYITKPFTDNVVYRFENKRHATYTSILSDVINDSTKEFFPSLIQERIEVMYELRVFFLEYKLFPARLVFHGDTIDYRKEQSGFCNAQPYKFNIEEGIKIIKFIEKSGFKTGSIDLIRDKNNTLFFLEINPNGAYEWISSECNYNISLLIAEYFNYEN